MDCATRNKQAISYGEVRKLPTRRLPDNATFPKEQAIHREGIPFPLCYYLPRRSVSKAHQRRRGLRRCRQRNYGGHCGSGRSTAPPISGVLL